MHNDVCLMHNILPMRTTLDLPQDLIENVMKLTGAKTKSEAIITALQDLIDKQKRIKLLAYKGKFDLDLDLNALRKRK